MRIVIDLKLCEGNERCVAAAPEVFEVHDDQSHLRMENPPSALMEKIRLAIRMCPRQAISLSDR